MVFELNFVLLISMIFVVLGQVCTLEEQTTHKCSIPKLPVLSENTLNTFLPQNFDINKCLQKSNSLLCNEADDYPRKKIQKILSSKVFPPEFFGNDSLPITVIQPEDETKNHEPSDKHAGDDEPLDKDAENHERGFCESKEELKFPKIALNRNLELRYIVQGDSTAFQRGILTESCVKNTQCMFASYLPPEISVQCVEKYLYKKLIALDPSNGEAYVDEFPVPACCVCMFKEKDD